MGRKRCSGTVGSTGLANVSRWFRIGSVDKVDCDVIRGPIRINFYPQGGGLPMEEVMQYLAQAETCLRMAATARSENMRAHVVELARQWTKLAAERENFLRARSGVTPARLN
jgi:hypothetical protein